MAKSLAKNPRQNSGQTKISKYEIGFKTNNHLSKLSQKQKILKFYKHNIIDFNDKKCFVFLRNPLKIHHEMHHWRKNDKDRKIVWSNL